MPLAIRIAQVLVIGALVILAVSAAFLGLGYHRAGYVLALVAVVAALLSLFCTALALIPKESP